MGRRSSWMKLVAAISGGLLIAFCFPPFALGFLVWIGLIPLLAALWGLEGNRRGWKGFGLGWLAGTASCLVQFNWLSTVSWLGAIALPVYLGLFWGAFGAYAATLGAPRAGAGPLRQAFGNAAVWAGLEWLRGWLFTGFGWNGLGVAFAETRVFAQAADLLGATGLSILPVFFQAVLVQWGKREIASFRDGFKTSRKDLVLAAAVVALVIGYGLARIATERRRESTRLKTLLVQNNIPQDAAQVLWSALDVHLAYEEETTRALEALKSGDPARWPDWVMWPECALTGRIYRCDDGQWGTSIENRETVSQVRKAGSFQLIYGVNELEAVPAADGQLAPKEKTRAWNSIAVMNPDDELQTYRKHHLVIFGETIPFVDSVPLLKKIYEQQAGVEFGGSFTPGVSFDPLPVPNAAGRVIGAIPTVCFEDSVPRLIRKFHRPGPQVIVNVTNDGWFKESSAAAQHFANARFRAIELRRPMLRCANTGVSAAIDSTGSTAHPETGKPQILTDAAGSHFTRGSLLTELEIPLRPSFSLYVLIGDWGVIGLAVLAGFGSWMACRKSPRAPIG